MAKVFQNIDFSAGCLIGLIVLICLNVVALFVDYVLIKCNYATITAESVARVWPAVVLVCAEGLIPLLLLLHFIYY